MSQATPNTQNQNQEHHQNQSQSQSQHAHEGQSPEQAKPIRPRRARRPASGAKSAVAAANAATPAAAIESAPSAPAASEPASHAPQTQTQPQAAQPPRARRARRPAQSQPQAQPVHGEPAAPAAALAQSTPSQAPQAQAELPPTSPPVAALPAATPGAVESAEAPAAQQKKRTTRGGRGHRGGRKNEVQLVKPAESAAEQPSLPVAVPEIPAAQETAVDAEPRVVPVVTEAGPSATEPVAESDTAAITAPAPAPAASRFRFGRRGAATTPESPLTPAPAAPAAPTREAAPMATLTAPAATARPAFEEPAEEEPWQATVAEIAVESLPNATETRATSAVDDLVAALGLQGAGPNAPAPATPEVTEAVEAMQAEDAAAEARAETEAEEDHQGTRRRRRRRGKGMSATAGTEETAAEPLSAPEWVAERERRNGYERPAELSQPYSPYNRPPRERLAPVTELEHPEQYEESPFGSPEPQMARGFGPQPRGVAGPAPSSLARPARERERLETPPISPNQLGNVLTHAIQQQTDRLLGELRRQPQGPAMTVAVPLPSTERVGIFVDVANLLYSARSQRIALDFGRLLDFLRGNRRLIRAHAYAPTNPEQGAEQSFLNAVRGLGYRITTKNFKTFASGAKKADMDLDLCMDIVRMVDAGALDTVVLVSGDSDFLPLLEYASDKGVRVEVAAFEDAAAMILRQSCDLFINLSLVEGLQK